MAAILGPDGKFVDVTDDQAQQLSNMKTAASATEDAARPKGSSLFTGVDGKLYNVPETSYDIAIKNGWKLADQKTTDREAAIKRQVNETGQLEGGLKNFANEALLGIPNYISNKEAGPEQASIDEAVRNRISNRDPVTHAISSGLGFIAPLAVPGVGEVGEAARLAVEGGRGVAEVAGAAALKSAAETVVKSAAEEGVAKAATASLTRKIAGSAADLATQSAIYASPKAAVQVAYGEPEQAAETMLWGIGLGAITGGAGRAIGVGLKAGASAISEPILSKLSEKQPNGITYADDIARTILGITDKQAKKLGADKVAGFVNRADELGILQSSNKVKLTKEIFESSGKKIGEHLDELETHLSDPEVKKLVTSPLDVSAEIQKTATEKFPEIMMETHASQLKELNKIVKDVGSGGVEPSFEKLQEIRTGLQAGKKAFDSNSPNAEMYKLADNVIQKNLEQGAQAVYTAGKEPAKFADYLQAKADNYMSRELLKNNNPFKGTGRIPSLESLFGAGSSVMNAGIVAGFGHPGIAFATMAGKKVLQHIADNKAFIGGGASILRKLSKDPASVPILGGLIAKEGQSALMNHLNNIPQLIKDIPSKAIARGSVDAVSAFLGDEAKGLSKDQQFKRMSDKLSSLSLNDTDTANQVGHIASVFTGSSLQLASLVAQKKMNAIAYLNSQLPKNPNGPKPFQNNDWQPSKQDKLIFERKLAVVMNPMSIWSKIHDHTVTADDVATLQAVYPKIYSAMVEKVINTAYDPKVTNVSHAGTLALSTFTGMPLDPSLANVGKIQTAIKTQPKAANTKSHASSSNVKMDKAPHLTTDVQRRTYK